jgi:tetrahydromethanopterin S-methyltransferase subunit G
MKFPTTNGKQTQGIGLKIARKIGIGLTDMSQVQIILLALSIWMIDTQKIKF